MTDQVTTVRFTEVMLTVDVSTIQNSRGFWETCLFLVDRRERITNEMVESYSNLSDAVQGHIKWVAKVREPGSPWHPSHWVAARSQ